MHFRGFMGTNAVRVYTPRRTLVRVLKYSWRRLLATITPDGQALVREATEALNQASFGLPGLTAGQAAEVTNTLRALRVAGGDAAAGTRMPPEVTGDRAPAGQAGDPDGTGAARPGPAGLAVPLACGASGGAGESPCWAHPSAAGVIVAGYSAAKAAIES